MSPTEFSYDPITAMDDIANQNGVISTATVLGNIFLFLVFGPIETAVRTVCIYYFIGYNRRGARFRSTTVEKLVNTYRLREYFINIEATKKLSSISFHLINHFKKPFLQLKIEFLTCGDDTNDFLSTKNKGETKGARKISCKKFF